jgi:outer membrane protein OmpA-like peptidoglycan-associated protein
MLSVKHSFQVMFLLLLTLTLAGTVQGQNGPIAGKLAPDQAGCVDSKYFPKLLECRIDNCEKKESDHRDVSVAENDKGDPVTTSVDGSSRSVMYECREGTTPASIVEQASGALKTAGFDIPYRFAEAEASLTARKDDLWVLVDSASRFYTLTEMTVIPPDFDSVTDADSIFEMLERYGHVPLYGIQFLPGRADLAPSSVTIMHEILVVMQDHPTWRFRIEGHTDNTGSKMINSTLSFRRASAVVAWLAANGGKRTRLDAQGLGDTHPIADNTSEAGRTKNRRIELVKMPPAPGQEQ